MWAQDYTDLRDRPKRWYGIKFVSRATGHGILMPAALTALLLFAAGALVILFGFVFLYETPFAPLLPIGIVLNFVAPIAVYFSWNNLRPNKVTVPIWASNAIDYLVRQPKHFYGFHRDREPTHLNWTVIVYDQPTTTTKRRPR